MMLLLASACASRSAGPPTKTVDRYAQALRAQDSEAARQLLAAPLRQKTGAAEARRLFAENKAELAAQASGLEAALRQAGAISVEATVELASGEHVLLREEQGGWRIQSGALIGPTLAEPRDAVGALRRAIQRRSFQGFQRVLARKSLDELEGLLGDFLRNTDQPDALEYKVEGDRARAVLPSGRELLLVRERGQWRVLEMR